MLSFQNFFQRLTRWKPEIPPRDKTKILSSQRKFKITIFFTLLTYVSCCKQRILRQKVNCFLSPSFFRSNVILQCSCSERGSGGTFMADGADGFIWKEISTVLWKCLFIAVIRRTQSSIVGKNKYRQVRGSSFPPQPLLSALTFRTATISSKIPLSTTKKQKKKSTVKEKFSISRKW